MHPLSTQHTKPKAAWHRQLAVDTSTDRLKHNRTMAEPTTSLLDLEDDDDSSSCSSFTVATVLSRSENVTSVIQTTSLLQHDDYGSSDDDDYASFTVSSVLDGAKSTNNQQAMPRNFFCTDASDERSEKQSMSRRKSLDAASQHTEKDDDLRKLRCTYSLMDDSFDSTDEDNMLNDVEHKNSPAPQEPSSHSTEVQKTIKKSNRSSNSAQTDNLKASNRDSIFRRTPINGRSEEKIHLVFPARTLLRAPDNEKRSLTSFDSSLHNNSLLDNGFDELDREVIKRRKNNDRRCSNKFLSVYDDLSQQAIEKSMSLQSRSGNNDEQNSKVKRMKDLVSTAVQSITDGAINADCDDGTSWGLHEQQTLSGKKRSASLMSDGLKKLLNGRQSYIQMQILAEREEERQLFKQKLKEYNTQIKYLRHENFEAYESVTLARTESIAANESKKEAEEERDKLKKRVVDSERECKAMKEAMLALAEAERHRLKAIRRLESKLKRAKALLEEATNSAVDAEKTASALRNTIEVLQAENKLLSDEINDKKDHFTKECNKHKEQLMTAKKEAKKWRLQVEENAVEISMLELKLATARKSARKMPLDNQASVTNEESNFALINAFGAEDVSKGSELFTQQTFATKLPVQTSLKSPPSSRQLSYNYSSPSNLCEKENQPNNCDPNRASLAKKYKCCLCFKDTTGVMRSCQCGQTSCDKRAHATCLAKYKIANVGCVSHPGTPIPQMPLILCTGVWKK